MKRLYRLFTLFGCLLCLFAARPGMAQTGTVLGFGQNTAGELGDSTTTNRSVITPAHFISGVKDIACGFYHTLALDSTGNVWAWGDNTFGQLGNGTVTKSALPVYV